MNKPEVTKQNVSFLDIEQVYKKDSTQIYGRMHVEAVMSMPMFAKLTPDELKDLEQSVWGTWNSSYRRCAQDDF
jgi:hypothetical protein